MLLIVTLALVTAFTFVARFVAGKLEEKDVVSDCFENIIENISACDLEDTTSQVIVVVVIVMVVVVVVIVIVMMVVVVVIVIVIMVVVVGGRGIELL